jgi:hypothetical protein
MVHDKGIMKTISCKEAVEFILKKEEGKLSLMNRLSLWRHLIICSLCAIFYKQNKLINDSARHRKENHYHLSPGDKEQIIRNVIEGSEN